MNILDCVGTQWQSVYDHAADGNEVEKGRYHALRGQ